MTPAPGDRLQRFVGDRVCFWLKHPEAGVNSPSKWRALLRTNLGRAGLLRREIIQAHTAGLPLAGASWRDLAMRPAPGGWSLDVVLAEPGYFQAKAYLIDEKGWQHWPAGPNAGLSVSPEGCRCGNTVYCAFPRLFGTELADNPARAGVERELDQAAYTVIPPSGKLRDLIPRLPHIFNLLGCRILQLLPVTPVPTTGPRFGRYGSPYAALDLTAIDPALVVFDRRTTGVEQFCELAYETHLHGGRLFLDIVINHTGWGSGLQEDHPEWFLRHADGTFASPGAWGVTWEDLVELKHFNVSLWDELAEVFLTWCRRGVDGFRCDAGYKVPAAAWQYIVARVQQEHPRTIFLLEGLGGAWESTEALLTEGGLHWAYSELFQNYSGAQVASYLDHSMRESSRVGLLLHYSETHDNERLASKGRAWSLLRNRLCGLTSVSGGFGFTCGAEWLATEKIRVHGRTGLRWGEPENLVLELAALNRLLAGHPCFFDGARLTRLSPADSPVYALLRESGEGLDRVLVLVNTDVEAVHPLRLDQEAVEAVTRSNLPGLASWFELLEQAPPEIVAAPDGQVTIPLPPGGAFCLAPTLVPAGLHGRAYRQARMRADWAVAALSKLLPVESIPDCPWQELAAFVDESPTRFLNAVSLLRSALDRDGEERADLREHLRRFAGSPAGKAPETYTQVVTWTQSDVHRVLPVPPGHWLLIQDSGPFRARLAPPNSVGMSTKLTSHVGHEMGTDEVPVNVESLPAIEGHFACFPPRETASHLALCVERYTTVDRHLEARIQYLSAVPEVGFHISDFAGRAADSVLLANGRGGMARLCVDLGRVNSKYDCVLGANLHPDFPVDRHVFAKRIRAWINADGFLSPLDLKNLAVFDPGPPAVWNFVANAGDARTVEIQLSVAMPSGRNSTLFRFSRPTAARATGKQLPPEADVRLTVRVDIEDRNFHCETKRNGGAEHHFSTNTRPIRRTRPGRDAEEFVGFAFTPAPDRQLRVKSNAGRYHPQPEWSENIPHPAEQSRGQVGSGDAWSPGWFELPLPKGGQVELVVTSELAPGDDLFPGAPAGTAPPDAGSFSAGLARSISAFVVRREAGKTIIAGYPWFLDWGRDAFIGVRGLIAAGMTAEARSVLLTFARFEKNGTLPNSIFGGDASNRDTSDAPLWFALACEELAASEQSASNKGLAFYSEAADPSGRTLRDILESIGRNYIKGTPNGIRMDPTSALVWSPAHFTWMDTNYPAGTPREGYPVEIQALWVRLLSLLGRLSGSEGAKWNALAARALESVERYFWRKGASWYADLLRAARGCAAPQGAVDDALRGNALLLVSLGLSRGERARRCVDAALRHLVVPGALRSLAPLPVSLPLPIYGNDGALLNDPQRPYWGHYEGDEDTRRKPAYHNGTAWTWTLPVFCEALARAWDFSPEAVAAAMAYLGSMAGLMTHGCIGHIPEILDGDAPHCRRGCDAQAWAATEALRVWTLLKTNSVSNPRE